MPSEQTNRRALLERVEGATGDPEQDWQISHDVCLALFPSAGPANSLCEGDEPIFWHDPFYKQPVPALTASIDAALALVERVKADSRAPQDVLSDAIERMGRNGFNATTSIVPQIARYVLIELLTEKDHV